MCEVCPISSVNAGKCIVWFAESQTIEPKQQDARHLSDVAEATCSSKGASLAYSAGSASRFFAKNKEVSYSHWICTLSSTLVSDVPSIVSFEYESEMGPQAPWQHTMVVQGWMCVVKSAHPVVHLAENGGSVHSNARWQNLWHLLACKFIS